ncbi:MAG: bifunctional phosphopantothenoylcysteine decarboxylase/phosphopantothenate--cysteine ligase CoaBC [Acidobacteria bacterium]|nr:bifunctional phosphopantothenoylcysteine decarboxylase/phosphopantothenate--cysteine ligase CoaBC [Acidobacteriota bacterium]
MSLIALGVTGGIGAYKSVEVCRGLQRHGHEVVAVMTRSAARFVGPVTFEAITRRPVITSQWKPGMNARLRAERFGEASPEPERRRADIEHIAIADQIALLLVAPCTANVIGKFAAGIADDFLSSLYLAARAPVLLAPAMNSNMLAHDAVQQNLRTLAARGVRFVEPGEGYLACGWIGKGRLAEPADIVAAALAILSPVDSILRGRHVVVTAGPTCEDIDAVRYVGNRSSGRMGFALAAEARRRGARVTLVAGPTGLEPPAADDLVRVRSAAEMHAAVTRAASRADVVIMAAAVADYTPSSPATHKVPKTDAPLTLTLARTRDILADLGRMPSRAASGMPILVGFAAETGNAAAKAREKRARKGVDLMVANDVARPDAGFEVQTNAVTIIGADGEQELPVQAKDRVAAAILDRVEQLLRARAASPVRA